MSRTHSLMELRDALAEDAMRRGTRIITNSGLVQLIDALFPQVPKAAPVWPKNLYSRFTGKEKRFYEQKSFNKALEGGLYVEHPAEVQRFPQALWRDGDPAPRVAWNRLELEQGKQDGYAVDSSRTLPLPAFRTPEKPQAWPVYIEQCVDNGLKAEALLHWRNAGENEIVAGHLSDWISQKMFSEEEKG